MKEIRNVGVIGLGKMGMPMARLLRERGFTVTGYDVALPVVKAAAGKGIQPVNSPKAVAAASDLIIIAVGFDSEVEAVMFGDNGAFAGAADGSVIAIASTVAPATMRKLKRRSSHRPAVALLDIPLCRGEQAAERGKLLIMGGGDKAAFDACRPAFAAFADAVFHLGPLGAGEVGKMVNNLILWACISANDEGLKLGNRLGVDRDALREALVASSASNWALASRIEEQPMPWAEKDMTIVLKEADLLRMSVPLCGVVKEVVKTVKFERNWPTPHAPDDDI
jgi:3-hydroxyisobutyrate dehydrogenase-like beta-hydroxyacid dehydrogenase